MSMIGYFQQVTPMQLEQLKEHPEEVEEFLHSDNPAVKREEELCIDTTWHGLHYLLTGEANGGEPPLSDLIMPENTFGVDLNYGAPSYLNPSEVSAVENVLSELTRDELASRFEADEMIDSDIYPGPWDSPDEDAEYVVDYFDQIQDYFSDATQAGNGMIFYIA